MKKTEPEYVSVVRKEILMCKIILGIILILNIFTAASTHL